MAERRRARSSCPCCLGLGRGSAFQLTLEYQHIAHRSIVRAAIQAMTIDTSRLALTHSRIYALPSNSMELIRPRSSVAWPTTCSGAPFAPCNSMTTSALLPGWSWVACVNVTLAGWDASRDWTTSCESASVLPEENDALLAALDAALAQEPLRPAAASGSTTCPLRNRERPLMAVSPE